MKIARALDGTGVERIEAGLPSVSQSDKEAIRDIAYLGLEAEVCAFARCTIADVDNPLSVGVDGLIMEVPSSDHPVKYDYGWSTRKAVKLAVDATNYAHA